MTFKTSPCHHIEIKTYRNHHKDDVPTFINAIEFFLDELLKRCTIQYCLNIKIILKNGSWKEGKGNKKAKLDGEAWEHVSSSGAKWHYIQLNGKVPFLELISTLAHETIHVVQLATGRLNTSGDEWIWDGQSYGEFPYTGDDDIDNKLPWEYDAYSKEIDLARKFIKQYYSIW